MHIVVLISLTSLLATKPIPTVSYIRYLQDFFFKFCSRSSQILFVIGYFFFLNSNFKIQCIQFLHDYTCLLSMKITNCLQVWLIDVANFHTFSSIYEVQYFIYSMILKVLFDVTARLIVYIYIVTYKKLFLELPRLLSFENPLVNCFTPLIHQIL